MTDKNKNVDEREIELPRKVETKRFIDRNDWREIVKSSDNFYKRGHEQVPNWMVTMFFVTQVFFLTLMVYFSAKVIMAMQQQSEVLSVIQYMLFIFVIVTVYSLYIVKKLKSSLTATEYMSLFLSKSLESYSSCFALVNKKGKIIFYNENFANDYMYTDEVETKNYRDILNKDFFSDINMEKIQDSLDGNRENSFSAITSTANSQTMRNIKVVPLIRPEGVFVIKVITVKIIKGNKEADSKKAVA